MEDEMVMITKKPGIKNCVRINGTSDIPDFLKGLPITLIAASLLAVSFFGFQGLVDGMLG